MAPKLCLRRQPCDQTVPLTTAWQANCASGDSPAIKLCLRRQLGAKNGRSLSPDAQFGLRGVARCTVWLERCRQMHSLVIKLYFRQQHGDQTVPPATTLRSNCAADDSTVTKLCLRRQAGAQTVPLTTAMGEKRALIVARCTVWPAGCRQRHSLMRVLSSDAQFGAGAAVVDVKRGHLRRPGRCLLTSLRS